MTLFASIFPFEACLSPSIVQPVLKLLYEARLLATNIDEVARSIGSIVDALQQQSQRGRNTIMDNFLHKDVLGNYRYENLMLCS